MIFVFITAAFIINRQEIDNVSHRESTVDTIVNQVEYVFRIMTNQGKIVKYIIELLIIV